MLEQSITRALQEMADNEQPHSRVSIQRALRDGRNRLRRRRLVRAAGTPALAAGATLAVVLASALPATIGHSGSSQAAGYGRFVGGAFDPSYLAIRFGWLPKGANVTGGMVNPAEEEISAYATKRADWGLTAYARDVCHAMMAERRFRCSPTVWPVLTWSSAASITSRGPVIDGHRSLWLSIDAPHAVRRLTLAWEYAPGAWALVQNEFGSSGAATAVRIARGAEFGQHIPFIFAFRFTSLPRGWRIIGLYFNAPGATQGIPAGVYLASGFSIARLRTISPATPDNLGNYTTPDEPVLGVTPVVPNTEGCTFIAPRQEKYAQVTIHAYRLTLGILRTGKPGHVQSDLQLCGAHDGLSVGIDELGSGAHPHLGLSPVQLMERMQPLGTNPADWVTNPLP